MIRFVDLYTGNVFDGSKPYIFWFDGEQSVNLFYTKQICFISHDPEHSIEIEDNDYFHLLEASNLDESLSYDLGDITRKNLISIGAPHHNYFVHTIYICGMSPIAGEYICDCKIDDCTISIGADFNEMNESSYINLSNRGLEIPESIQKAIYPSNVHESKRDDILLNRKWKELLSNFLDIVSNKGSYKSLYNSLNWFEYGDLVKLKEVWKIPDNPTRYIDSDITNKYTDIIDKLSKTTYVSLSLALDKIAKQDDVIVLDGEKNPVLEQVSFDWSVTDMALKMCMLGHFYKAYFMPIHLDLLYSSMENIVFSNTIKTHLSTTTQREDFIYDTDDIVCNVQDGDSFLMDAIECYSGKETLFGKSIGVQTYMPEVENDLDAQNFKWFKGVGSIVKFEIQIPLLSEDLIKKETLKIAHYHNSKCTKSTTIDHKPIFNKIVEFDLLFTKVGEYKISIQLDTACGSTYIKNINFYIDDSGSVDVKIYKVTNNRSGLVNNINDYVFGLFKNDGKIIQYIPSKILNPYLIDEKWEGICFNHIAIYENLNDPILAYIKKHYNIFSRQTTSKTYYVCISKDFGFKPSMDTLRAAGTLYKHDYIFIPDYHTLKEFPAKNPLELDSYIINDYDTLCAIPSIPISKKISKCSWEFINVSDQSSVKIATPVRSPFISNTNNTVLTPGYYDVLFRYKFDDDDEVHEVRINSAFIKK